eukprot:UC4_evm5s1505
MSAEFENIVVNSQLVRVRNQNPKELRAKNWRQLLQFPNISSNAFRDCKKYLTQSGELEFLQVFGQPLGRELFNQFVNDKYRTNSEGDNKSRFLIWKNAVCFLLEHMEYETIITDEQRFFRAKQIFHEYLDSGGQSYISVLAEYVSGISLLLETGSVPLDLFVNCTGDISVFLKNEAMPLFIESLYGKRFLQWKLLEQREVLPDQFRRHRLLGKGGFGEVSACLRRESGEMYAVKELSLRRIKEKKAFGLVKNERDILQKIYSKFVVGLYFAYRDRHSLYLVMHYMHAGDLHYHLKNTTSKSFTFDESRACFYAAQICLGLEDLQKHNIVYRDMKPENILMDSNGNVRISDLGLAMEVPPGKAIRGRVGTPGYMAPEVISNEKYSSSVDWWGLGCVIFEMLQGHCPFRNKKGKHKIKNEDIDQRVLRHNPEYDDEISSSAQSICELLLQKEPKNRLGCGNGNAKPGDARAVMKHPFFDDIDWKLLRRMEVKPPWVPDENEVYAKSIDQLEGFPACKGELPSNEDIAKLEAFEGVNGLMWQEQLLQSWKHGTTEEEKKSLFEELNPFNSDDLPNDLREDFVETEKSLLDNLKGFCFPRPNPPIFRVRAHRIRRENSDSRASVLNGLTLHYSVNSATSSTGEVDI